ILVAARLGVVHRKDRNLIGSCSYCTRGASRLQSIATEIATPCCPHTTSHSTGPSACRKGPPNPIGYRSGMEMNLVDRWICGAEVALRTLSGGSRAERAAPAPALPDAAADAPELDVDEKRLSGALMRVNHVGEVCAQALYQAQALATSDPDLKAQMAQAARDE